MAEEILSFLSGGPGHVTRGRSGGETTKEGFVMRWPQITMIVFAVLSLYISLTEHGKPRGPGNFWYSLIGTLIQLGLLWAGGFWK
jgi:hypothetical protein